jgi:regulator of CtrA degradation
MQTEHRRTLEALYRESVELADEARGWFDGPGLAWRATLDIADQALVATESLATTARLLAIIAWALDPRHVTDPERPLPFVRADVDSPVALPLQGQRGGAIAATARRLTSRAAALTAAGQTTAPAAAKISPPAAAKISPPAAAKISPPPAVVKLTKSPVAANYRRLT